MIQSAWEAQRGASLANMMATFHVLRDELIKRCKECRDPFVTCVKRLEEE